MSLPSSEYDQSDIGDLWASFPIWFYKIDRSLEGFRMKLKLGILFGGFMNPSARCLLNAETI